MQGRLIVFEGVEGVGKTTQLQRVHGWLLAGKWFGQTGEMPSVVVTREPGGTQLGLGVRQLLLEQRGQELIQAKSELLLYAADRAQHVETVLKPTLSKGAIVLCDRFTDSTIAYQGYGRGLEMSLIEQLNQIATGGLTSDLTLWLDLDAEIGLERVRQRGGSDRIEQSDLDFHLRVQAGFLHLHQRYPDRIVRIDANRDEAAVTHSIQHILMQYLDRWYGSALN